MINTKTDSEKWLKVKNPFFINSKDPDSRYYFGPVDEQCYLLDSRAALLHAVDKLVCVIGSYTVYIDKAEQKDYYFDIPECNAVIAGHIYNKSYFSTSISMILYDNNRTIKVYTSSSSHSQQEIIDQVPVIAYKSYYKARLQGLDMEPFKRLIKSLLNKRIVMTPKDWASDLSLADISNIQTQFLFDYQQHNTLTFKYKSS